MSFMQPEVFHGRMWSIEGNFGEVALIPARFFSKKEAISLVAGARGAIEITGWWGRYQAPGYLDSTDWSGPYGSEAEALEELKEMFGEEEEEDDGDDL